MQRNGSPDSGVTDVVVTSRSGFCLVTKGRCRLLLVGGGEWPHYWRAGAEEGRLESTCDPRPRPHWLRVTNKDSYREQLILRKYLITLSACVCVCPDSIRQ